MNNYKTSLFSKIILLFVFFASPQVLAGGGDEVVRGKANIKLKNGQNLVGLIDINIEKDQRIFLGTKKSQLGQGSEFLKWSKQFYMFKKQTIDFPSDLSQLSFSGDHKVKIVIDSGPCEMPLDTSLNWLEIQSIEVLFSVAKKEKENCELYSLGCFGDGCSAADLGEVGKTETQRRKNAINLMRTKGAWSIDSDTELPPLEPILKHLENYPIPFRPFAEKLLASKQWEEDFDPIQRLKEIGVWFRGSDDYYSVYEYEHFEHDNRFGDEIADDCFDNNNKNSCDEVWARAHENLQGNILNSCQDRFKSDSANKNLLSKNGTEVTRKDECQKILKSLEAPKIGLIHFYGLIFLKCPRLDTPDCSLLRNLFYAKHVGLGFENYHESDPIKFLTRLTDVNNWNPLIVSDAAPQGYMKYINKMKRSQ